MNSYIFYLEKVAELDKQALNALKARQLAKSVGIIPHSESQWKYALRNSRNGRGEILQGKELADAHARLGKPSNNIIQQVLSSQRKIGKSSDEFLATHDSKKILVKEKLPGAGEVLDPNRSPKPPSYKAMKSMGDNNTIHTHPSSQGSLRTFISNENKQHKRWPEQLKPGTVYKDVALKVRHDTPHSVLGGYVDSPNILPNKPSVRELKLGANSATRRINEAVKNTPTGSIDSLQAAGDAMTKREGASEARRLIPTGQGDLTSFSNNPKTHSILGVGDNTLSVNKVNSIKTNVKIPNLKEYVGFNTPETTLRVPASHRQVFFDVSPKGNNSAKRMNQVLAKKEGV